MTAIRLIPCLDVDAGRVVKGVNFVNMRDAGDPVEVAARYNAEGADELCMLDISATLQERSTLLQTVRGIADQCFIPLTVGGGICSLQQVELLLKNGADKISINSHAVAEPDFVTAMAQAFGSQCTVIAIDVRRTANHSDWEVYTRSGSKPTGLDALQWAERCVELGAGEILLTSMDRDGTRDGYDCELLAALSERVSVPVIASGGAGSPEHLVQAVLQGRADAVLAASIFHYRDHSIADVKIQMAKAGIEVRI